MMLIEQLILFLNLIFGSIFVYRIIKKMIAQAYYSKTKLTKIGIAVFCFYFLLIIVTANTYWTYLVQILLCLLLKRLIQMYMSYYLQSLYWREFPRFLSHLKLRIQLGEGFRSSVRACLPLCSRELQHIISRIMEVVVFSQHSFDDKVPMFIYENIYLFKKIDRSPHLSLTMLKHAHDSLLMKKNFRHKSGQILLQTYIQSTVLVFLYCITVAYSHFNYSIFNHSKLFLTSLILMMFGVLILKLLTRSFKWSE